MILISYVGYIAEVIAKFPLFFLSNKNKCFHHIRRMADFDFEKEKNAAARPGHRKKVHKFKEVS